MSRSYIRTTLVIALVLVQLNSYAQTGASSSVSNNAQIAADAAKTVESARAQVEKAKADNSAAQNSTSAATANQDQSAKTGDSTSISNSSAQAPSQVKNEVTIISSAPQSVEQPTTVISAAPLAPSRADEIRRARERAEVETEQGIVEKLEKDRLEDETKRRENLFGKRKKHKEDEETQIVVVPVAPPVVAPAPVAAPVVAAPVVSAPAAVVNSAPAADSAGKANVTATSQGDYSPASATATIITTSSAPSEPTTVIQAPVKSEAELRSEIESDIRAENKASLKNIVKEEEPKKNKFSVGGVLSTLSYPDAFNTNSDFGAGVSFGWQGPNRLGVEGTFMYSQHTIDDSYWLYKNVDQQNWMVAARYNVLAGSISPVVGALVSYTHREYTDMYDNGYGGSFQGPNSANSDSIDVGLILGVEFQASKNITLGVDYRYITNMTTRYSDPDVFNRSVYQSYYDDYKPLEEIDYDMVAFSVKFLF